MVLGGIFCVCFYTVVWESSLMTQHTSSSSMTAYRTQGLRAESYLTASSRPNPLMMRITLLSNSAITGVKDCRRRGQHHTPGRWSAGQATYLSTWLHTCSAIILHLSQGTVQINSFQDHNRLILWAPPPWQW